MKIYASIALFLLVTTVSRAGAHFSAKPGSVQSVTASSDHAKYTKQWTLNQNTEADAIDVISLKLMGTVFISYIDGLSTGVLGYVNVTGDSQTVVDTVVMRNDNFNRGNHKTGVLNITTTTVPQEGYLLTEVFLSSGGLVVLESERSAHVVIEVGVLATNSKKSDLIVEASGSSTVLLSDTNAAVMVGDLVVEASNSASIQLHVASISVASDVTLESTGSSSISILSASLETAGDMILETQRSGTICTSAKQVIVEGDYISESTSGISMPNAPNMFGATGTLACNEVDVPVREPASVTRGSPTSNSASATNSASLAGVDADTNVSIVSSALSCTTQFGAMFAVSLTTMGML